MESSPLGDDYRDLWRDLVLANRILANEGVLDAFGHVSVRHPDDAARFVIPRSLGPERVTAEDLQVYTLADEQVGGSPLPGYAERAIHAAIYRARPDVLAICHNHAPSTIPFGTTGVRLRPIFHMAGLMGTDVPVWEPRADFGDTDMLVRTPAQGNSLARVLGDRRVALMRGHGAVAAGQTLREVVMCCVYLEHNARLQLQAMATGAAVTYLSDGEIELTWGWQRGELVQQRAWDTWASRIAGNNVPQTGT